MKLWRKCQLTLALIVHAMHAMQKNEMTDGCKRNYIFIEGDHIDHIWLGHLLKDCIESTLYNN